MQPKKKHLLKSYFTFTANERRAVLLLVIIAFLFFILPYLYPAIIKPKQLSVKQVIYTPKPHDQSNKKSYPAEQYFNSTDKEGDSLLRLFYFDPNTATSEEWIALGVKEKTAQTIIRYRLKGGKFRLPVDLKKIWGLSAQIADRLIPYVRIKPQVHEEDSKISVEKPVYANPYPAIKIDINIASHEEWEKLKGIGPATSARIIKFREKLGGFISVEQIGETYGLQDSVFQMIRPSLIIHNNSIKKININYATIEELGRHPYIKHKTAKSIIAYRDQNGPYKVVSDLQKIESITSEEYKKMEIYLTVDK